MHRHAITSVETLLVFSIAAVLIALLLPAIYYARESARSASCANNLRQLTTALEQLASVRKKWPPHPEGTIGGWAILVLPFLEDSNLADALSGSPILDPNRPPEAARQRPWVMTCPSGFDGDSEVKTVPAAHYFFSSRGMADVPISLRAPWIVSPDSKMGLPNGKGPHWGRGYNVITGSQGQYDVRFVDGD